MAPDAERIDAGGRSSWSRRPVIDLLLDAGARVPAWAAWAAIAFWLPVLWYVGLLMGGTSSAAPHLFYIPVLVAAVVLGHRGAVPVAVVSGALAGPLMPGDPPSVPNELFRGAMFLAVGLIVASAVSARQRRAEERTTRELELAIADPRGPVVEPDLVHRVPEVLERRALAIVYQPVYRLDDGRLIAVEALARFPLEPARTPDLWFAAAARAGLAVELEVAAVEAAVAGVRDLPRHVALAVNTSPGTLASPRLHELLGEAGRPVVLELTEHSAVPDYDALALQLAPLRAAGVKVAVDDAGAGFASLQHIVQLAPDIIKIDLVLTQGMDRSPVRRALGRALVDFGHRTGATVVVEGVETAADLLAWAALGADAAQGFLLGRPGELPPPVECVELTQALHLGRRGTPASAGTPPTGGATGTWSI